MPGGKDFQIPDDWYIIYVISACSPQLIFSHQNNALLQDDGYIKFAQRLVKKQNSWVNFVSITLRAIVLE